MCVEWEPGHRQNKAQTYGMLPPRRVLAGNLMAKIALAEKVNFDQALCTTYLPRCRVCRDEVAVASCGA